MKRNEFSSHVLKWFDQHGRHDLPWQQNPTPYRVWVSEIMLQQTQVSTVIAYYLRFMQTFPTLKKLALANEDAVLDHWTGLGYYARARNLHKAAKIILEKHRGEFPETVDELIELPGIGRSTAGAIISLSKNLRAPILDGNVKRVFARLIALDQPTTEKTAQTILWNLAEELMPKERFNAYNQALMDLGATLCTRSKPACAACPVQQFCAAYQHNAVEGYPVKKAKPTKPEKSVFMLLLENAQGEIFLQKRPPTGIWGGLWSLPEIDDEKSLAQTCRQKYALKIINTKKLNPIKHVFSHFVLHIQPIRAQTKPLSARVSETDSQIWYNKRQSPPGGFAAPVLKLIKDYDNDATR